MDPSVITVILFSTFMHAGWNLMARRSRHEGSFFLRMLLVSAVVGLVPAAVSEGFTRSIPPMAWICVLSSGICCGVYYFFLAHSYEATDFTVVYPVARSLPVVLVGIGDVMRGRYPTPVGWLGMGLVVLGCLFVPLYSFRDFSFRPYWNRSNLWLVLTALGTVGYTMLDKIASEILSQGLRSAAIYGYFFFLISLGVYALGMLIFKREEVQDNSVGWIGPSIAAVLNFGAYWLVLWAYQLSLHGGYIVAFRQFSIVIGVFWAFRYLGERGWKVRITGTMTILLGLVFIALLGV